VQQHNCDKVNASEAAYAHRRHPATDKPDMINAQKTDASPCGDAGMGRGEEGRGEREGDT
jgi:hypothetical protein